MIYWIINIIYKLLFISLLLCLCYCAPPPPPPAGITEQWTIQLEQQLNVTWT